MKTVITTLLSLLATVTYALASGNTEVEGLGLMATFFIAFGVLIILFQFVPGLLLLFGMLKGLFSPSGKKATAADSK